ncbi:hypothetical protein [Sneathiella sp.]|uniref:hypothetical protein n=1 Tax=Sneathiella sp. TaxID=1964365 RepID=UPI0035634565
MHNRNFVAIAYISAVLAIAVMFSLSWDSYGGIDVDRYWDYSYVLDLGNTFYVKELVSWVLLQLVGLQFDRPHFVLGVGVYTLVASVLAVGPSRGVLLYASFLSPFGILLQFNVMRQGFATVFIAGACLALARGRIGRSAVCSVLGVLSHNSALIPLAFVYGTYALSRLSMPWRMALISATILLIATVTQLGLSEQLLIAKADSLALLMADGLENFIYCILALSLCVALWLQKGEGDDLIVVCVGLALAIITLLVSTIAFSIPSWIMGRLAISIVVVCTFLLLNNLLPVGRSISLKAAAATSGIFLFAGALILMHPGALSMIG